MKKVDIESVSRVSLVKMEFLLIVERPGRIMLNEKGQIKKVSVIKPNLSSDFVFKW